MQYFTLAAITASEKHTLVLKVKILTKSLGWLVDS